MNHFKNGEKKYDFPQKNLSFQRQKCKIHPEIFREIVRGLHGTLFGTAVSIEELEAISPRNW